MKEILTRNECSAMRGIAIIAIMLHNYCHFIGKIVKENEYMFQTVNNDRLWYALTHPDELLSVHLLSYFGHYGVPVFLFLSGLGLVLKYEASPQPSPKGKGTWTLRTGSRFILYHYLKLLRMLIVGFTLFLMVDAVTPGRFAFHWDNVLAQLLMYINVLPEPDKIICLLLYRRSSWVVVALIVVCWLLQVFCDPDGDTLNRLRYNFIGGMLPFGLGILAARIPKVGIFHSQAGNISFPRWEYLVGFLLALFLIVAMGFWYHSWLWVPVFIIIGTIALVKMMPECILKVFVWFGGISAAMFVVHPIVRKLFITVAWRQDIYDGLMLYVVVTIALSWAVKQVINRIPAPKL